MVWTARHSVYITLRVHKANVTETDPDLYQAKDSLLGGVFKNNNNNISDRRPKRNCKRCSPSYVSVKHRSTAEVKHPCQGWSNKTSIMDASNPSNMVCYLLRLSLFTSQSFLSEGPSHGRATSCTSTLQVMRSSISLSQPPHSSQIKLASGELYRL